MPLYGNAGRRVDEPFDHADYRTWGQRTRAAAAADNVDK